MLKTKTTKTIEIDGENVHINNNKIITYIDKIISFVKSLPLEIELSLEHHQSRDDDWISVFCTRKDNNNIHCTIFLYNDNSFDGASVDYNVPEYGVDNDEFLFNMKSFNEFLPNLRDYLNGKMFEESEIKKSRCESIKRGKKVCFICETERGDTIEVKSDCFDNKSRFLCYECSLVVFGVE